MIWRYYTERLNIPPAPWPVSAKTRWVNQHTFGFKLFGRYFVITWEWSA